MIITIDTRHFEVKKGDNGFLTISINSMHVDTSFEQSEHLIDVAIEMSKIENKNHSFMCYLDSRVKNYFED